MLDPEAESQAMKERSAELTQLLDASHPVVGPNPVELAESRRLADAAHKARGHAAAWVLAGVDPGVPVGYEPPIRRVRTDARGRDLDPFRGSAVVTDELVAYWEHRRDVVAPAVEVQYCPRPAAVGSCGWIPPG